MENEDKEKQIRALIVSAALDLTRFSPNTRKAMELVLVDGMRQSDAARLCKMWRQDVYHALRRLRPKLNMVEAYVKQLQESGIS